MLQLKLYVTRENPGDTAQMCICHKVNAMLQLKLYFTTENPGDTALMCICHKVDLCSSSNYMLPEKILVTLHRCVYVIRLT